MEVKRYQENEQQKTIRRRMIKPIQERIVRDITNLLDQEEDCCKPAVSTGNFYSNGERSGDKNKTLSQSKNTLMKSNHT